MTKLSNPLALEAKLTNAIEYAVLAPSSHNTQPWLFRLRHAGVQLLADRTRALPVVDPHDRALVISCGAALYHLRIAMQHHGLVSQVATFPEGSDSDVLANVDVREEDSPATQDQDELFSAILKRRTNRFPFQCQAIATDILAEFVNDAKTEGAWIHFAHDPLEKDSIADLVSQGDRLQASDKSFRRELAAWIHPNRDHTGDGMPGYSHGVGDFASNFGPFIVRTFDWGNSQAAKDRQLAEGSPLLVVLGTAEDSPEAWLRCGQALARILLRATAKGISASFLNQPIEVDALRPKLGEIAKHAGHPQILLRMGYGADIDPTPRRALDDVILR